MQTDQEYLKKIDKSLFFIMLLLALVAGMGTGQMVSGNQPPTAKQMNELLIRLDSIENSMIDTWAAQPINRGVHK